MSLHVVFMFLLSVFLVLKSLCGEEMELQYKLQNKSLNIIS